MGSEPVFRALVNPQSGQGVNIMGVIPVKPLRYPWGGSTIQPMSTSVVTQDDPVELGNRRAALTLKAVQNHRGMTNKELAAATQLPVSTVQAYTSGTRQLTAGHVFVFADRLGIEPEVLFMAPNDAIQWMIEHAPNEGYLTQNWKNLTTERTRDDRYLGRFDQLRFDTAA